MPSILNNVAAMSASRQIGITQMGLKQAIERLTTGKRINRASDDAAGMAAGTTFEAIARTSKEKVKGYQNQYYAAQSADAFLEEATNLAYRLAELEGSGNSTSAEYTAVQGLIGSAFSAAAAVGLSSTTYTNADSTATLTSIQSERTAYAATMATAQSNANIEGIKAENNFAQADTIMGADIGSELVNLTKFQILMQAGVSALGNANQSSQFVLGLFR